MLLACCAQRPMLQDYGHLQQGLGLLEISADLALKICIFCASVLSTRCVMHAGGERLPDAVRWRDEDDAQQQPAGRGVQLPHALLA